jgi:hypothetical protein
MTLCASVNSSVRRDDLVQWNSPPYSGEIPCHIARSVADQRSAVTAEDAAKSFALSVVVLAGHSCSAPPATD